MASSGHTRSKSPQRLAKSKSGPCGHHPVVKRLSRDPMVSRPRWRPSQGGHVPLDPAMTHFGTVGRGFDWERFGGGRLYCAPGGGRGGRSFGRVRNVAREWLPQDRMTRSPCIVLALSWYIGSTLVQHLCCGGVVLVLHMHWSGTALALVMRWYVLVIVPVTGPLQCQEPCNSWAPSALVSRIWGVALLGISIMGVSLAGLKFDPPEILRK